MWYVIQTIAGKEMEAVQVIDKVLAKSCYTKCFVIQRECVWRIKGQRRVHIEPLFPSYIFVESDTPEDFFFALKKVPKMTKLLGDGNTFWSVEKEDIEFLKKIVGNDKQYIVRRSLVEVDSDGTIISAEGFLKEYIGKIVKKRLRKRIVLIEFPFLGRLRQIEVGIRLHGDEIAKEK